MKNEEFAAANQTDDKKRAAYPFYSWMPKPLGCMVLFLMFFPVTFSGGAYMNNMAEMAGGMGVHSEDIQLASYATSIGMALFAPFMAGLMTIRRVKHLFMRAMLILLALNGVIAVTDNVVVTIASCLVIGFFRVMLMMNITFTLVKYGMGIDALSQFVLTEEPSQEERAKSEHARSWQMAGYYGVMLIIAQLGNVLTAYYAWHATWRHAYYVVMVMLLVALILVKFTMPDEEKTIAYKWEWRKMPTVACLGVMMVSLSYILVCGKTLDWFSSPRILWAVVVLLVSSAGYLWLSGRVEGLHWEILSLKNVWLSALLFTVLMVLFSCSMFVSAFAKLSTQAGNFDAGMLAAWAIVGCVIGLVIAAAMAFARIHFRWILAVGFGLILAADIYLYFQYQTEGSFENMALVTIINYAGLFIPYAMLVPLGMKHLPVRYMTTYIFIFLFFRNALAPVAGMSLYSNWLQERQQHYIQRLAQNVDNENLQAATYDYGMRRIGQARGGSTLEAQQLSATALRGKITVQATLVAMRDITSTTIWLLVGTIAFVLFFPYHRDEYA